MRLVLQEEIKHELSLAMQHERQLVYILVLTRKLIDSMSAKRVWPRILFLCDWVVHNQLDRNHWSNEFLRAVDLRAHQGTRFETLSLEDQRFFHNEFSLDGVRQELIMFYGENRMEPRVICDPLQWREFILLFGQVVNGSPLILDKGNNISRIFLQPLAFTSSQDLHLKWRIEGARNMQPYSWTVPVAFNTSDPRLGWA